MSLDSVVRPQSPGGENRRFQIGSRPWSERSVHGRRRKLPWKGGLLAALCVASTVGTAAAQDPEPESPELPELRRSYVVMLDGNQQGTVDQSLRYHPDGYQREGLQGEPLQADGPVWESVSRMSAPLQEHERILVFSSPDHRPIFLEQRPLRGGDPVLTLQTEDARIRGFANLEGDEDGATRDLDVEAPPETLLPGMDDYLLAVEELTPGLHLSAPMLDPQGGGITSVTFQVAEEAERVEVPAGTFEALRVRVDGGPSPQTLLVRREWPHVVLRQELHGDALSLELTYLDEPQP